MTGRDLGFADPERERALLIGIIEAISADPELDPLASHVASLVTDATGTDLCYVYVLDDSGRSLTLAGATPPLDLAAIGFPIQAINGEFDTPISKTQRLAREAKNFTAVILPGRGHNTVTTFPVTPPLYIDAIANFVRGHDPK